MNTMTPPHTIHIGAHHVTLQWDDGETQLEAAVLRQHCRCTGCRQRQAKGLSSIVAADLCVTGATPIGSYGVQFVFSDGHERGIFPWRYLRELALPA
jgi:DUF971 family protein